MRTSEPPVPRWRDFRHVIFDCDSTLSAVEGIDVLAEANGLRAPVETLTETAMRGGADLGDVYAQRLDLVKPSRDQVAAVVHAYRRNAVTDAAATVTALKQLGHEVYVVSGGLGEPVREFAHHLGVPADNVRAVESLHDRLSGRWWTDQRPDDAYAGFEDGPLTVSDGKAAIIRELLTGSSGRSMLVGDGMSDLRAGRAVDLFIGFGGVARRPEVAREARVFLDAPTLAPVLLLAAGPDAGDVLGPEQRAVFDRGAEWITTGAVTFSDPDLATRFAAAFGLDKPAAPSRNIEDHVSTPRSRPPR